MPNFPAFQNRLAQLNNPFYRSAKDTPMEFGIPAGQAMGPNPMKRRPNAVNGAIPLIQDGNPQPSGTSAEPQMATTASRTKTNIANQVDYDDLAPKMEEIPGDPEFQGHSKHGFFDRLRAMAYSAQAAQAQQPENQMAGLGGMIGGLINPGGAERLYHEEVTLPRARKKQAATIARNESRQKAFQTEMAGRLQVQKLNEANQPEYAPMAGGEYSTVYNKRNPTDQHIMLGPDGKPMRPASIINTEERGEYMKEIQGLKDRAAVEKQVADAKLKFELAKQKADYDREKQEMANKFKEEMTRLLESGRNSRFNKGEAGKNERFNKGEKGKNDRNKERYGDDDGGSSSKVPVSDAPNAFMTPKYGVDNFALPKRPGKHAAPPAQ